MSGTWLPHRHGAESPPARGGPASCTGDVVPRSMHSRDRLVVAVLDGEPGIATPLSPAHGLAPLADTRSYLIPDLTSVQGSPALRGPRNAPDPCRGEQAGPRLGRDQPGQHAAP
jgi:hypothetical protein